MTGGVQKLLDFGERAFVLIIYATLLFRLAPRLSTHPHIILLAISELLVVLFILIRRPGEIAPSPYALLIAFGGTAMPMLVRPDDREIVPDLVGTILMMGGLCLTIWAKLILNRSFGIVAANRGVKVGGPYRLVRHPMYLGYIITQAGFLSVNFSARNVAIYAVAWTFQILRVREEEKLLRRDPAYEAFACHVSSRLIPRVY